MPEDRFQIQEEATYKTVSLIELKFRRYKHTEPLINGGIMIHKQGLRESRVIEI